MQDRLCSRSFKTHAASRKNQWVTPHLRVKAGGWTTALNLISNATVRAGNLCSRSDKAMLLFLVLAIHGIVPLPFFLNVYLVVLPQKKGRIHIECFSIFILSYLCLCMHLCMCLCVLKIQGMFESRNDPFCWVITKGCSTLWEMNRARIQYLLIAIKKLAF